MLQGVCKIIRKFGLPEFLPSEIQLIVLEYSHHFIFTKSSISWKVDGAVLQTGWCVRKIKK
jgi:hypothetical protein